MGEQAEVDEIFRRGDCMEKVMKAIKYFRCKEKDNNNSTKITRINQTSEPKSNACRINRVSSSYKTFMEYKPNEDTNRTTSSAWPLKRDSLCFSTTNNKTNPLFSLPIYLYNTVLLHKQNNLKKTLKQYNYNSIDFSVALKLFFRKLDILSEISDWLFWMGKSSSDETGQSINIRTFQGSRRTTTANITINPLANRTTFRPNSRNPIPPVPDKDIQQI